MHHGAPSSKKMIILTEEDRIWLSLEHPHLRVDTNEISGILRFTAVYDELNNKFFQIEKETKDTVVGVQLSGSFTISVKDRTNTTLSRLPALYVEGIEPISNRHFNPLDRSACLCSPLEEEKIINSKFDFTLFMKRLVIPFLYGQTFYTLKDRWPWAEYAHGVVGILESYDRIRNPKKIRECLLRLTQDLDAWLIIKIELLLQGSIKSDLPCFCKSGKSISICHKNALSGIRRLKNDVWRHGEIWYIKKLDKMLVAATNNARLFNPLSQPISPSVPATFCCKKPIQSSY